MSEPRFGNCRDCACWVTTSTQEISGAVRSPCIRHAPIATSRGTAWPWTSATEACFDYIPSPPETDNG